MSLHEAGAISGQAGRRTPWYDRRHEWLLMYQMGMEPTAIAQHCRTSRSRVKNYLDEHLESDPLLWHRRLLVHSEPSLPRHVAGTNGADWDQWYRLLVGFVEKHGRLPRHTSGATMAGALEVALYGWAREQHKSLTRHDTLTRGQRLLLFSIPGLTQGYGQGKRDALWRDKLRRTSDFIEQEGRWPSESKPFTSEEQVLGRWTSSQRRKAHRGLLSVDRRDLLAMTLPDWASYLARTARDPD